MTRGRVAIVAMGGAGQYQRLRAFVAGLVSTGIDVWVFSDEGFEPDVTRFGGHFVDLYAGRPLAAADTESLPMTCRYVTYAARFADDIARAVAEVRPSIVMADTFAVAGIVVARILDLPYVNLCHGHDVHPGRVAAQLEGSPLMQVGPACHRAVDTLRDRYGFENASPLSWLGNQSSNLNVYFEPEQFISDDTRKAFEPIAFYGSLPDVDEITAMNARPSEQWFDHDDGTVHAFVSFGTLVWTTPPGDPVYTSGDQALAAYRAIGEAFRSRHDIRGVLTVGRAPLPDDVLASLSSPNVRIERWVDQWQVLQQADLFVTHQGLNSTHEAILHEVPMVSYPFFIDHPMMAARCQDLGLAVPLTSTMRGAVTPEHVHAAIDACLERHEAMAEALARARSWELDTIARRGDVLDRIASLL